MSEMHWEDPPDIPDRRRWTAEFIAELKRHPGKWARVMSHNGVDEFGSSTRNTLTSAGCDLRSTTRGTTRSGYFRLWARWPE